MPLTGSHFEILQTKEAKMWHLRWRSPTHRVYQARQTEVCSLWRTAPCHGAKLSKVRTGEGSDLHQREGGGAVQRRASHGPEGPTPGQHHTASTVTGNTDDHCSGEHWRTCTA